jgi:hypothetical protein
VQTGGSLTLNSGFTNIGPLILYAGSTFAGNGYTGSPLAIQLDVTNETTHYIGSLSNNITIINDSNTNPLYRLGGPSMTSLLPGNILQGNTIAGVSGNVYLPNNGNSPYTTDSTLVSSLGYFGIGNATRGMLESAPFKYGQPEDTMGAWSLSANLQGLLVPANYYRDKLVIQLQAGGPVYLGFGAAASAGSGVQLTTVGSVVIVTGPLAQMAVYGITQSGSTTTGGYQENLGVCD